MKPMSSRLKQYRWKHCESFIGLYLTKKSFTYACKSWHFYLLLKAMQFRQYRDTVLKIFILLKCHVYLQINVPPWQRVMLFFKLHREQYVRNSTTGVGFAIAGSPRTSTGINCFFHTDRFSIAGTILPTNVGRLWQCFMTLNSKF
jgi:hypothetical protein